MPDAVSLLSPELFAVINPLGAQLSVLRDGDGRDLLWNGDAAVWSGRAPILFPIIGELAGGTFRVGSSQYKLPRHGFARNSTFQVVRATDTEATFRLTAGESTLPVYPYDFQFDVSFRLTGATLTVESTVRNVGAVPLTASIGYHPGFRWPLPYGQSRAAHYIEFKNGEGETIRRLNSQGLLSPDPQATPVERGRLVLRDELFREDVVIFENLRSHSLTYGAAAGPRLQIDYPDATYLGIWTKPKDAPFVCIEPWRGIADVAGFKGEFRDKLGAFQVAPGGTEALTMSITLLV